MNLSKSKFKQFCRCPRLLWLDTYRKELVKPDPAMAARAETGNEITRIARGIFGAYTDVTVMVNDRPDLPAMVQRTAQCMNDGIETICEASFIHDGLYCAVDILHAEPGGYAVYEVKSGTGRKSMTKEGHDIDIAFQCYVLQQCGVNVTGAYIVTMDPDYVRGAALDVQALFRFHDMQEYLPALLEQMPALTREAKAVLAGPEPECGLEERCLSPNACPYWKYCAGSLPKHSVFDLYNCRKKWSLYRENKISFHDLEGDPALTPVQQLQVHFELHDCEPHIDREKIAELLGSLKYPLYFLDFEAMQHAIPELPGAGPYDQIPFQYSLHYITQPGGKLEHSEFLGVSGEDPRRDIAEALCRDISVPGSVIVYNQSFEETRLKELEHMFPDLAEGLAVIRKGLVDFLIPFKNGHYYNKAMGGSFSIKSVLPALFPDDDSLDYKNLEGNVHNGTQAMDLFPQIRTKSPEEQEEARRSLLEYCKLDTYAMVKVWQKLCEAIEET